MSEETKYLNIGLVMPIAPIDGCSMDHWMDVKRIITEAISSMPGYSSNPKIVSEGDSSGLIHKRIVEGLYTSDIIICDVSCKNPNVMFELGMRLAFDKPTIIIKDDKTDYTFDAGVIEHLQYPRDLRYKSIVEFKELLSEKVRATYEESIKNGNQSSFLKSFGTIKVASLKESEVSADHYIINALQEIQSDLNLLKSYPKSEKFKNLDKLDLDRKIVNLTNLFLRQKGITAAEFNDLNINELFSFISSQFNSQHIKVGLDYIRQTVFTHFISENANDFFSISG